MGRVEDVDHAVNVTAEGVHDDGERPRAFGSTGKRCAWEWPGWVCGTIVCRGFVQNAA